MRRFAALILALAALAPHARAEGYLIHGGPIYVRPDIPPVEALVVRGGKVAFAGALAQARKAAAGTEDLDLKGAAAFPGFVDAHAHLMGIGFRELTLNLEGTASAAELATRVKAWNAANPGTGPLVGRGWIETHWPEKRFPTRQDLDAVLADRPVMLTRADGHALVANSAMLALAAVTRETADPPGGQILKDPQGDPTGMLIDNAQRLVSGKVPPPSLDQKRLAARRAVDLYAARGWTGLHNVSVAAEDVAVLRDMAAAGALPIRVDNYLDYREAAAALASGPTVDSSGLVRVDGVKLYMDGALGSRGAALLAPYSDAPGSTGLLVTPPETVAAALAATRKAGLQAAVHAIGDRGNRLALDLFERTFADDLGGLAKARWRIEHAQVISPPDLPRFAKLGVIASMQPSHAIGDLYFAPARLGPERLKGAYAWETLLKSGAHLAGGSDAPVERGDPLVEFYAAAYRHDLAGKAGPDWGLEDALTRPQALAMLTSGPAYAVFREADLGDLSVGKQADISVFSVDLMTAPFADIPKAHAVMTLVGGRIVYRAR